MKQRIEYIDALRGFTMILVVFSHVITFSFNNTIVAFNNIFIHFRMPLFFFISGWLFYKHDRIWNYENTKTILKNKFLVQIVPTLFFFIIFLYVQNAFEPISFGNTKKGYWFTIALFEYFVLYIISGHILKRLQERLRNILFLISALVLSFLSFYYELLYHGSDFGESMNKLSLFDIFLSAIGFIQLKYYLFFIIGTLTKQFFDKFIELTNNQYFIAVSILSFGLLMLFPFLYSNEATGYLSFVISGITGIVILFTFFRINAVYFSKNTTVGLALQFVGRRTLDIYLLHYFFVYAHLERVGGFLIQCDNTVLDFYVTLTISFMVLAITLFVSSVIRLSPILAHFLFGVKKNDSVNQNVGK